MFDNLSIIYLEDEPLVALDTSEHLESLGFRSVKVATRLTQAEKFVSETQFDLALLDINVGKGQTSLALGEALAAQGTKVIFASGNSSAGKDLNGNNQWFLDKPFSLGQLSETLGSAASAKCHG